MRILLVSVLAVLAGAVPASGNPPQVGSSHYLVRGDPRLCPSPICGGYWVALANRSRTRCSDGALRPRCYVARAVDEDRHPVKVALPDGSLVRGAIEPWAFEGFGELGALVVADIRVPSGRTSGSVVYRVRDLGARCVRAPCFSMRASRVNGAARVTVSELDLGPARLTGEERRLAQAALTSANGLFLAGRIERMPQGGRRLVASRIYLRAATPRG